MTCRWPSSVATVDESSLSSTVATDDGQRHVIYERAGGREILNRTQYGKEHCIGSPGSRTSQLRLEALVAELLTCVVDRLSDAVGINHQHVANAELDASTDVG